MNLKEVLNKLKDELNKEGIISEVVSIATTGSSYLRFPNNDIGGLRIGDHPERRRYGYRWQLRTDIDKPYIDRKKGHNQYFYPVTSIKELVNKIKQYIEGDNMAVINAPVKWASVQAPNETYTPVWSVDVVLDEKKAKELHAQGLPVKRDKDGDLILKIKKKVYRKDGTRNLPPKVVGPDKQPFLELIGNGSVCNVQYNTYPWTYAGSSGVGAGLIAVQVVEHHPYAGQEDELEVVGDSVTTVEENVADAPDFDDDLPF